MSEEHELKRELRTERDELRTERDAMREWLAMIGELTAFDKHWATIADEEEE